MPQKKMPKRSPTKKIPDNAIYNLHEFSISVENREIFLTSNLNDCVDDAMIDHYTAATFIKNLQLLNSINSQPIIVHQITCGGEWNYGMAIYDAIKVSCNDINTSNIVLLAYAHARSMSSIIPQAATKRIITSNADFLIHWGTNLIEGNYTSVQAEAEWSKRSSSTMLDVYVERCQYGEYWVERKMSPEKIKSWLRNKMDKKQEFYMTPQEAVEKGFMDGILGDEGFENIEQLRKEI